MPEKLKHILFPPEKVIHFANVISEIYPDFAGNEFYKSVCDAEWRNRELKEKMRHTTLCLHRFLPGDFAANIKILTAIVPKISGFEGIVLPDYVEVYGQDYWDIALPALGVLTQCGTSEFAIRPFLNKNLEGAMKFMLHWADHSDFRVRRFASEGCRPRLPWGSGVPALKKNPALILPILEKLKNDPEEFVRKSVANNLNDISKDHPGLVLDICERWKGSSKNTDWIIKHACRSLLKLGNKRAMLLFGFANPGQMRVENLTFSNPTPKIGDTVTFSFDLKLDIEIRQKVRLEYKVYFIKSSGKPSPKVFQIKEAEMEPGIQTISKKHSFANFSTRNHFVGSHKFEIVVNGETKANGSILLT